MRILMKNTFLVLKTVNPSEFSLNMRALPQGRIRNHKKRVAQKDHDNFVAVVVCLFAFLFLCVETSFSRNTEIDTEYQILTNYRFGEIKYTFCETQNWCL